MSKMRKRKMTKSEAKKILEFETEMKKWIKINKTNLDDDAVLITIKNNLRILKPLIVEARELLRAQNE